MKLLWLTGWYPNRTEPLTGDFIQRHAAAVALQHEVEVIHVLRDGKGIVTKSVKEETFTRGRLKERIIYYYIPRLYFRPAERLLSLLRYRSLYRSAIKDYLEREGRPALTHVQILGKNGWMALWLKRSMGIPYVVSDQWTGYLPEAKPDTVQPFLLPGRAWQQVMRHASGFSVVSDYLGKAMQKLYPPMQYAVIPNVVDSHLFYPDPGKKADGPKQFIHISTLGYQKNPEAMFRAFAKALQAGAGFRLSVFGPARPELTTLVATLGLSGYVSFHTEVPQQELATWMRKADALLLYSRYETFGCVLIEANACGLPAIVSDIPVH
ncbi:MAG: glycosyltransferase, partial [Bacteroidetes bacterium]|nr:glycosyltransferase [Bacteroidota bacterium]